MNILFEPSGSLEAFESSASQLIAQPEVTAIIALIADDNGFENDMMDPILKKMDKPIFGGIFPAIIHEQSHYTKGSLLIGIKQPVLLSVIKELSDNNAVYEDNLDTAFGDTALTPTTMVFVDGFAKRIGAFMESLFNVFGLDTNFIGGGAGSLSMQQKPCIITNQGLLEDAAIVALIDIESGLGVNHGWSPIAGPFQVTESSQTTIHKLNHLPAFEVYKQAVEEHSNKQFTDDNFFDIAKAYPFGISKMDGEHVVRDPLFVNEESLVCVGEVPQGVFVHILNGNESSLIAAAIAAKEQSEQAFIGNNNSTRFFIDCISRVLFLGDNFSKELEAASSPGIPMIGACTLGEIANNHDAYLEFYNKTSVIINLG